MKPALAVEIAERLATTRNYTHRPADPVGCEVCRSAKLTQRPARRAPEDAPSRATRTLERVHVDTIGPLQLAHDHMKFILVARDEFSGWMAAVPIPSKTSPQVTQAFHQAFGFDGVETLRLDPAASSKGSSRNELQTPT